MNRSQCDKTCLLVHSGQLRCPWKAKHRENDEEKQIHEASKSRKFVHVLWKNQRSRYFRGFSLFTRDLFLRIDTGPWRICSIYARLQERNGRCMMQRASQIRQGALEPSCSSTLGATPVKKEDIVFEPIMRIRLRQSQASRILGKAVVYMRKHKNPGCSENRILKSVMMNIIIDIEFIYVAVSEYN